MSSRLVAMTLAPCTPATHINGQRVQLPASTSLFAQALGRPINEQVNQGGRVAQAPNRQAGATLRTLDELVMVGPVTQLPSEHTDEAHRVCHELRALPHGNLSVWGDEPCHTRVKNNSVNPWLGT